MRVDGDFRPDLLVPLLRVLAAETACGEICVRGTSMRPTLLPGDRYRVVAATAADVRMGDVVVYMGKAGPRTHRLVGWWPSFGGQGGWRILTKGDGLLRLDPPLPPSSVVGLAVMRVRDGRARRLDTAWGRLCGCTRAVASLAMGLTVEAWDQGCRLARR